MPVGFVFVFAWRQAWMKEEGQNACWICICVCLETGSDEKEGTKCQLDLLGIGLCTVIEIGEVGSNCYTALA